jgi:U4/U6 small nuclear ribonucleoprotein PRP4
MPQKLETWYHEGSSQLRSARFWIAKYSLPIAKQRVEQQKQRSMENKTVVNAEKQELFKSLRSCEIVSSQIGDTRPVSSCVFSPDDKLLATSSWAGLCKLWSVHSLQPLCTYRAHNANVGCITFHPQATLGLSEESVNLASCGIDGSVFLWALRSSEPLRSIKGHEPHRVAKVQFHPSGRFLATCCFDNSWRLFDMEHSLEEEILFQEGHSKPVYDIDFHSDGNLAVTGGLDSFGRVWDLRTGRCIMFMEGHSKGILSVTFAPDGYHIATGSEDHTVKIWNLRERKLEYTIAAHSNVVSKVRFDKQHSNFLVSASYDQTIKLWSAPNWTPIQTLKGHENKVMCVDITRDSRHLVSSSYDRTFKIWAPDPFA